MGNFMFVHCDQCINAARVLFLNSQRHRRDGCEDGFFDKQLDGFFCKHCDKNLPNLDVVPIHSCFFGKEVYMGGNNILYTVNVAAEDKKRDEEPVSLNYTLQSWVSANNDDPSVDDPPRSSHNVITKQSAVWSEQATLALLSLYDANKHLVDNPKKQGRLWTAISSGLLETWGIEMSNDQVRWKMNSLIQKYHEYIDNLSKTGRGTMVFKYLEQMEDIFHKQRDAVTGCTVASNFPFLKRKATALDEKFSKRESQDGTKKNAKKVNYSNKLHPKSTAQLSAESSSGKPLPKVDLAETNRILNPSETADSLSIRRIRQAHGTGSKVARTKVELEKQWLTHLANKEKRDDIRNARHETLLEKKKEALQLKKRQLAIKEKECEAKKVIADNKLKQQAKRHEEVMELERMKCKLMQKYLKSKLNESPTVSSDSDNELQST